MKAKYFILLFLSLILCLDSFAQRRKRPIHHEKYETKSKFELENLYEEGCENNEMANCYQLGLLYLKEKNSSLKKQKKEEAKKLFVKACDANVLAACEQIKKIRPEKSSDLLFYSALGLVGIAVFLITMMMFADEDQYKAQEKIEDTDTGKDDLIKSHGLILQVSRPFFRRYVSPIVSSMKNKKKIKEKYRRKLASAGLTEVLTTEDFYSFKLFLILGFPLAFLGIREFAEFDWSLNNIPLMAIVGYFYPDIWIKSKIELRQKEILRHMPFAVDMLALSVEAGLDFMAAMSKVIDKAKPSPLNDEFKILLKEIKIGASRAEALRAMAWRTNLTEMSSFCATLIAADSVGASIGPILKALSAEVRRKKSAEVEKAGATAATKILFPMIFLILPSVLLVIALPMAFDAFLGGK